MPGGQGPFSTRWKGQMLLLMGCFARCFFWQVQYNCVCVGGVYVEFSLKKADCGHRAVFLGESEDTLVAQMKTSRFSPAGIIQLWRLSGFAEEVDSFCINGDKLWCATVLKMRPGTGLRQTRPYLV